MLVAHAIFHGWPFIGFVSAIKKSAWMFVIYSFISLYAVNFIVSRKESGTIENDDDEAPPTNND